jgi:alpha-tubulin suppressor-like RCC1 family protein
MNGGTSCALSASGEAYCWGMNAFGTVGDGTTTRSIETNARHYAGGGDVYHDSGGWVACMCLDDHK